MSKPVLKILGQDVTKYLSNGIPVAQEQKEFNFSNLINNVFVLEMDNTDGLFGLNNTTSLFYQTDWMNQVVTMTGYDGTQLFTGIITDVAPNYSSGRPKTNVTVKSSLFNSKDYNVEYISADWETPADSFKNICDSIDFNNYSSSSVASSKAQYENNSCYWKVDISKADGQKLQAVLEKIALYSNTRIYNYQDNLYFDHWTSSSPGASLFITERDIITKPNIKSNRKIFYNQYNIGYLGGIATDTTIGISSRNKYGTVEAPEMSTGDTEELIYFKDLVSAKYIGDSIIKKGHKELQTNPNVLVTSTQQVDYKFKDLIGLNVYFKLDFTEESWDGKLFETIGYSINENTREITLTGLEVA
jgi:hypothetical protein